MKKILATILAAALGPGAWGAAVSSVQTDNAFGAIKVTGVASNMFVAGFIGSPRMNLFSGAVAAEYGATTIGIRPEHLLISDQGGKWKGRVGVSEHLGSDSFFYVEHTGLAETVTVRSSGDIALHHGDDVWLTPDEDRIHRFGPTGDRL